LNEENLLKTELLRLQTNWNWSLGI